MLNLISRIFVWWKDSTYGTALFTWRKGVKVGADDQGNIYYKEKNGSRRWVIFNGDIEASRIPPEWHGWLHYTIDTPPSEQAPVTKSWEKPHVPNMTGSAGAYLPPGSLASEGKRDKATGDYEAWTPS